MPKGQVPIGGTADVKIAQYPCGKQFVSTTEHSISTRMRLHTKKCKECGGVPGSFTNPRFNGKGRTVDQIFRYVNTDFIDEGFAKCRELKIPGRI